MPTYTPQQIAQINYSRANEQNRAYDANIAAGARTPEEIARGVNQGGQQGQPQGGVNFPPSMMFGGKSYDLSTAEGLKSYQDAYSKINIQQPSPQTIQPTPFTGGAIPLQGLQNVAQGLQNTNLANLTPQQRQQLTGSLQGLNQSLQRYQQGLASAKASGPPPTTKGGASSAVKSNLPQPAETTPVDNTIVIATQDPFFQEIMTQWRDYMSPANQRVSLTDTYKSMLKDSGLPELNTELMNMKNVINGTEDDIRNEVTKAGGFATDSQVMALAGARNKQLIKNYNTLLETKNSKEEYLKTMIGLEQQDRQATDQRFDKMMNFGMQVLNYRDKMQDNARNAYQKIADKIGYDGLAKLAGNDPHATSLIENTLGLGSGGLARLATYKPPVSEKDQLALDIQRSNLATDKLQRANIQSEIAKRNADIKNTNASDAAVNPDVLNGMLNVYKSTGVLPAFGLSAKSPLRAQFYAALGAEGGNQIVTEANTNKSIRNGLNTAYRTQQNLYSANQTAVNTLEKQLTLAQQYSDKVGRSGSPLLNKYQLSLQSGVFGDPETAALNNIVKTASYEFAKILSGASASISGVTVNSQADAETMLNSAMTKGQFSEVIGLMRKEAGYRLNTQKDTLTQLQRDLNNVGNLTESLKPIPPSEIPSGYYQASDGLLYKK